MRGRIEQFTNRFSADTISQLRRASCVLGLFVASLLFRTVLFSHNRDCPSYPATPVNEVVSDDPNQLSILLYNAQLRPRMLFANGQSDRTQKMLPLLKGYDAVVLFEVFDDQALRDIKVLHSYESVSKSVGQNEGFYQDSGIVVFSQWPILSTRSKQRTFVGDCEGNSCFNYRGVSATTLQKSEGPTYHIITAQMQAGDSRKAKAIRAKQYEQIREFVDDLVIPNDEPILFAASLPISPQLNATEFAQMQAIIGIEVVSVNATDDSNLQAGTQFNLESMQNKFVDSNSPHMPDALFVLSQNDSSQNDSMQPLIQPVSAQIRPMRSPPQQGWKSAPWFYWQCSQQHLSDHHAVEGLFQYLSR